MTGRSSGIPIRIGAHAGKSRWTGYPVSSKYVPAHNLSPNAVGAIGYNLVEAVLLGGDDVLVVTRAAEHRLRGRAEGQESRVGCD